MDTTGTALSAKAHARAIPSQGLVTKAQLFLRADQCIPSEREIGAASPTERGRRVHTAAQFARSPLRFVVSSIRTSA